MGWRGLKSVVSAELVGISKLVNRTLVGFGEWRKCVRMENYLRIYEIVNYNKKWAFY